MVEGRCARLCSQQDLDWLGGPAALGSLLHLHFEFEVDGVGEIDECVPGWVEVAIVEEALANQTDGYRMVCAFVRRRLGVAVNRKRVLRVLRVMRERKLIQRRRPLERRSGPASSGSSGPGSCGSST